LGGKSREPHGVPTQFFPLAFLPLRAQHGRKQLAPQANSQHGNSQREGGFNQAHFVAQKRVLGLFVNSHRPAYYNQARFASHLPWHGLAGMSCDEFDSDSVAPQRVFDGSQSLNGSVLQDKNASQLV